ncbi:MAG: LCP family protein [Tepidiformaceae bacterium]
MQRTVEEWRRPDRPAMRRSVARPYHRSRAERTLFVIAMLALLVASTYTSLAMLGRVTPMLFPGRNILNFRIGGVEVLSSVAPGVSLPGVNDLQNKRINLLIMGLDRRPSEGDIAGRTDSLVVASIDPLTKTTNMLSFPRDMWIDIHPANGPIYQDRINGSFAAGVGTGNSPEAGADQVKRDLKANFGIEVTHWVVMDFFAVQKLIDAVGGVDIDIPYELSVGNWYYSDDDKHAQYVSFPAGLQHLDGYHAVAFGRNRDPSDFARVKRQQVVMTTALAKVFSLGLLNNPLDLYDTYSKLVKTDVPKSKMPGYGLLLKDTGGRTRTYSLGDPVNGIETLEEFVTAGGADVESWNAENVQYWLSQVFTKTAYANSNVEIQNGYGGEEGATRAAALGRYLAYSKGLPTVYYGPDQPAQPTTTILLYGERGQLADDVAKWMNVPKSRVKSLPRDDSSQPDVVIVVGKDFKVPGT